MSPEDVLLLRQLAAAMQSGDAPVDEFEEDDEEIEEEEIEVVEEKPIRRATSRALVPRVATPAPRAVPEPEPEAPAYTRAPWYEHGMSETEAMVIDLFAKGFNHNDIRRHLQRFHNTDFPSASITMITDRVYPLIKDWQIRPLASCYPILYLDGIHYKVKDAGKIISKVAYIALGYNLEGMKEILGIWVSETEGAKFWAGVLTDIKNRGVNDVLITCVDGLKGFPEAIRSVFPRSDVQVCIVHQIRKTLMYIPHKDRKNFAEDLKEVFTATSEDTASQALDDMETAWPQYASYLRNWKVNWGNLAPFYGYPYSIRKMIYTTNTIENLNKQFRAVTKTTPFFHSDESLIKLLWLAQAELTEGWRVTARNWGEVMGQFHNIFGDRVQF